MIRQSRLHGVSAAGVQERRRIQIETAYNVKMLVKCDNVSEALGMEALRKVKVSIGGDVRD